MRNKVFDDRTALKVLAAARIVPKTLRSGIRRFAPQDLVGLDHSSDKAPEIYQA